MSAAVMRRQQDYFGGIRGTMSEQHSAYLSSDEERRCNLALCCTGWIDLYTCLHAQTEQEV